MSACSNFTPSPWKSTQCADCCYKISAHGNTSKVRIILYSLIESIRLCSYWWRVPNRSWEATFLHTKPLWIFLSSLLLVSEEWPTKKDDFFEDEKQFSKIKENFGTQIWMKLFYGVKTYYAILLIFVQSIWALVLITRTKSNNCLLL
jgi:hypothetical protein